ncbi:MAG: hypothetical protein FJ100_03805 [Deltaproteobacteria bacterium]|nr:hypothetical protein [Deltaproteobacteria bacterium]
MPELAGLRLRDAAIVLQQAGLPPPLPRYVEAYADPNTVVDQFPIRGQLVDSTTVTQLSVAKQNWVRYLPQIFQLTADNENQLLHEFLWVFQQEQDKIGDVLDRLPSLFRPHETEPHFLPWLASWIALQLESDWPIEKQRRWLRKAPALYSMRGTKYALELLLEMYIGLKPEITENAWPFDAFRVGVTSEVGISTVVLPPMNLAHCFVVKLPQPASAFADDQIIRIHRVIQAEKPAHTNYFLTFSDQAALGDEDHGFVIGEEHLVGEDDVDWSNAP